MSKSDHGENITNDTNRNDHRRYVRIGYLKILIYEKGIKVWSNNV